MTPSREEQLAQTFVQLADTLVADFDLMEFLHLLVERCVELLDIAAVGLLLADQRGGLRVMASSPSACACSSSSGCRARRGRDGGVPPCGPSPTPDRLRRGATRGRCANR